MSSEGKLYVRGMIAAAALLVLFPTWKGQGYLQQTVGPVTFEGEWQEWGAFGLEGGADFRKHAPLWSPPRPMGDFPASVRWPWQSPSAANHVELALNASAGELALAAIALGVGARGLVAYRRRRPDATIILAWGIAVGLAAAWGVIVVVAVLSMGYALDGYLIPATLGLGLVAGVAAGISQAGAAPHNSLPSEGAVDPRIESHRRRLHNLRGVVAGIVLAACLTLAMATAADWFRGPVSNFQYVRPQWPVNWTAAVCLWSSAAMLARRLRSGERSGAMIASLLIAAGSAGMWFACNYPPFTPMRGG